ncbi:glycosyltransferase [Falsarthrobacter nasiphocae]|uniref:glycosyltransferase n=1 Tax=Falsarthrobacter nasiphocae TaxID=189863 RepID=UPI00286ACD54|nr:glycosyltransferase [Falsarthrobacter nasiphocae]
MLSVALISMHTSPLHQPGAGDAGGMNVYVRALALELGRLGVRADVFTRADPGAPGGVTQIGPGARVISLDVAVGVAKDDLPPHAPSFAERLLAEGHGPYDVVHAHYWLSGMVGEILSEAWSAPLVHTMHTLALAKDRARIGGRGETPGRAAMETRLLSEADAVIVNTDAEREDVARLYGADPARVVVVPPGVDLGVFSPDGPTADRAGLGIKDTDFLVLFAGRLQRLKGPQVLVEALAAMTGAASPRLVILGAQSGEGAEGLEDLARELWIEERVDFLPPVPAEELAAWFRAADVVGVPSYAESFGLVALEAQACGTPVVAANVGGLPHAVADGETGVLVSGHRPADWAAALERLALNDYVRERLADGAAQRAQEFGWAHTAELTLTAYRRAVENPVDGFIRLQRTL